jgi:hypothetical protein
MEKPVDTIAINCTEGIAVLIEWTAYPTTAQKQTQFNTVVPLW